MAMLADAVHEISAANAVLGGSLKHQENRRHLVTPFLRFLREIGALSRSLTDIRPWHVQLYAIRYAIARMKPGHQENTFSAIRVVCGALGNNLSQTCSSRQLGLTLRDRRGTRRAQTPEEIVNCYCQPIAERFRGCMKLHRSEAHRRRAATKVPRAVARREAKIKHARLSGFPIGQMDLPTNALPAADTRPVGRPGDKCRTTQRFEALVSTTDRDPSSHTRTR